MNNGIVAFIRPIFDRSKLSRGFLGSDNELNQKRVDYLSKIHLGRGTAKAVFVRWENWDIQRYRRNACSRKTITKTQTLLMDSIRRDGVFKR